MTNERSRSVKVTVDIRYVASEGRIYVKVPGCTLTHITAKPANNATYHRRLWKHLGDYLRKRGQPAPAEEL